ncbi:MAG TPA: hypothetical protein EYN96_02340 [Candidatus Hydrogenedentes bacterium]|nr:hypothetical protein [Candidatus Hydrogenedentota bacterium]
MSATLFLLYFYRSRGRGTIVESWYRGQSMRRIFHKLLGVSLVCFTFGLAEAEIVGSQGRLEFSDKTLSHVWTQAHRAFTAEENSYRTGLLSASYLLHDTNPSPALRAHFYLDASTEYPRSLLSRSFFPSEKREGEEANYSLHWPALLWQYHRFSGDDAYVRTLVESALPGLMEHFAGQVSESGLLATGDSDDDLVLNFLYYRALISTAELHRNLGLETGRWDAQARSLKSEMAAEMVSEIPSVAIGALAVCFGVADEAATEKVIALIRKEGAACPKWYVPYVVEACFIAGEQQLAIDLMSFVEDFSENPSPLYLIPEYVFGVAPGEAGWDTIEVVPRFSKRVESARLEVPVPQGRVTLAFNVKTGAAVTVPVASRVTMDAPEGMSVVVKKYRSHSMPEPLSTEARAALDAADWVGNTGGGAFIWVSVDEQMLRIVDKDTVIYQARCASAEKGIGSKMDSLQTPLGWHSIEKKIGDDAPWGQVFRSRIATREVWQPGEDTKEDMVLSRVLLLSGEEPGLNKGGNVDSFARNIYIHGTNDEARIGEPSSHGCIRMLNDDVIEMYGMVDKGMRVLITGTIEEGE